MSASGIDFQNTGFLQAFAKLAVTYRPGRWNTGHLATLFLYMRGSKRIYLKWWRRSNLQLGGLQLSTQSFEQEVPSTGERPLRHSRKVRYGPSALFVLVLLLGTNALLSSHITIRFRS